MRKLYIVQLAKDFEKIIKTNKVRKNQSFVIYHLKNNLPYDRFGISVGKKLGNAVFRNKYKRKIRSIIDNYKKSYNNNEDYIIIMKRSAMDKTYEELTKDFFNLMEKIRKDVENEEKK